jgi:signal transduction histidine kinase
MKSLIESLHEPWKRFDDTVVDINSCIKQAASKVAVDSEAWVELDLSEEELLLLTTEEMLTEVFKVLIKNAREAMPDETNRLLKIRSRRNGDRIEVMVADQGMGIEPQIIGRIFDMRFSTKEGGLGFGLFWAKDFIEGLGGEIRVQSVLQKGTTFSLSFPAYNILSEKHQNRK